MALPSNMAFGFKVAGCALILALASGCAIFHHHKGRGHAEGQAATTGAEGTAQAPSIKADPDDPDTMLSLKHLPKGLLPDTQNAAHTDQNFKVE